MSWIFYLQPQETKRNDVHVTFDGDILGIVYENVGLLLDADRVSKDSPFMPGTGIVHPIEGDTFL